MNNPEEITTVSTTSHIIMSIIVPTPEEVISTTPGISITIPSSMTTYI